MSDKSKHVGPRPVIRWRRWKDSLYRVAPSKTVHSALDLMVGTLVSKMDFYCPELVESGFQLSIPPGYVVTAHPSSALIGEGCTIDCSPMTGEAQLRFALSTVAGRRNTMLVRGDLKLQIQSNTMLLHLMAHPAPETVWERERIH